MTAARYLAEQRGRDERGWVVVDQMIPVDMQGSPRVVASGMIEADARKIALLMNREEAFADESHERA